MPSVLLIDSDLVARASLREALRREADISIAGEIGATPAAIEQISRLAPGMVVLGLSLGQGLDLAARIMREAPRPMLVFTPERKPDPRLVRGALAVGALEVRPKLPAPASEGYEKQRAMFARLVRVLAAVPVVTRVAGSQHRLEPRPAPAPIAAVAPGSSGHLLFQTAPSRGRTDLLVIGASTGGPPVLEVILKALPDPFPLPIAIVQHMTAGFNREFARWLSETTGRRAVMVEEPVFMEPGIVYLAADDRHLVLTSRFELAPSDSNERRFQRPSVDVLFESAAKHCGGQVAAVLLTGMGSDGIEGMAALKACGAFTLAQKPESCVVDSMPRGAIDREIVDVVADPAGIAAAIAEHGREARIEQDQPKRR